MQSCIEGCMSHKKQWAGAMVEGGLEPDMRRDYMADDP
jgi:hypothetical protein